MDIAKGLLQSVALRTCSLSGAAVGGDGKSGGRGVVHGATTSSSPRKACGSEAGAVHAGRTFPSVECRVDWCCGVRS